MIMMNRYLCVLFVTLSIFCSCSSAFQRLTPNTAVLAANRCTKSEISETGMFSRSQLEASAISDRDGNGSSASAEELRRDWINRSVAYYSKVMREERRRNLGQIVEKELNSPAYQDRFMSLAARHYFALRKIKDGKPRHAEVIYRRIIDNLLLEEDNEDEEECDHAKLAITTLLLALHLQRTGASPKQTRSVFLTFFRVVAMAGEDKECACSAKVVGAFALFEMKQGNTLKSLQLARRAFELDPTVMQPLLNWKQFRDAASNQYLRQQQQKQSSMSTTRALDNQSANNHGQDGQSPLSHA